MSRKPQEPLPEHPLVNRWVLDLWNAYVKEIKRTWPGYRAADYPDDKARKFLTTIAKTALLPTPTTLSAYEVVRLLIYYTGVPAPQLWQMARASGGRAFEIDLKAAGLDEDQREHMKQIGLNYSDPSDIYYYRVVEKVLYWQRRYCDYAETGDTGSEAFKHAVDMSVIMAPEWVTYVLALNWPDVACHYKDEAMAHFRDYPYVVDALIRHGIPAELVIPPPIEEEGAYARGR